MAEKHVYLFGGGNTDGTAKMKMLLGGKGANLAEMARLNIPVPPGFTITTDVCTYYYQHGSTYPQGLKNQVQTGLKHIEKTMGAKFGDPKNPLLVSVRSGAPVSMPGMMDTILNLGLNDKTVEGLARNTNNERFAWDSYRRFVQMYGDVVLGLRPASEREADPFEQVIEEVKRKRRVTYDIELTTDDLKEIVRRFKQLIRKRTRRPFPEDPYEQLWGAIGAVFGSWNNERAIIYRRLNKIPEDFGTAVNVQTMVFGNMGEDCATGVAFTRNPATGEKTFYGEYLTNAQGEDVVAGIRTPKPIKELKKEMPEIYDQLVKITTKLERHYRDMQDVEFTIQKGKLWMLQTRAGKRTGFAAIRIAVDMVNEGLISEKQAIMRIEPEQLNHLLRPVFDIDEKEKALKEDRLLAKGLPAGPGAATGRVAFTAEDAERMAKSGDSVILVRTETSPEDIKGMRTASGILTARGGMTSHAALVARQMGKVCVVGCSALEIDYKKGQLKSGDKVVKEGDYISLDGTEGKVIEGKIKTQESEVIRALFEGDKRARRALNYKLYSQLMRWADKYRKLQVWANADQPDQARTARTFGAQGIGLCRTEHMFFKGDRIDFMRQMILSDSTEERKKALAKLKPIQKRDFIDIFKEMEGLPVTIRFLDPPLHEFLPHTDREIRELAQKMGVPASKLKAKVESLKEFNPMLGHRGCRLGITYPEVYEMQAAAILEAACELAKRGRKVRPEIMIPLVAIHTELKELRERVDRTAKEVFDKKKVKVSYRVGTMIELPRASLTADEIAEDADFFSFGTNDLTQTTYGLSRDDSGEFLAHYIEHNIVPENPFVSVDRAGVGQLMKMGVEKGRKTNPALKVGICGEQGGDPDSIEFCHEIGLNYVSCSPYRVPIARLAAAQAALRKR